MGSFQSGQMVQTVNLLSFDFGGSNPSLPTNNTAEVAQLIEHQPSKLRVASLSLVFRSKISFADCDDGHSRFFCALLQYATSKNTRGGMHSASRLGCIDYPKSRLC